MLIQFIQKASDFVVRHKKVFSLLLLPITGVSILFGLLLIAPIFMVGRTLGLKMAYAPTDASQTVKPKDAKPKRASNAIRCCRAA